MDSISFNFSAVSVSNETLETVTSQAEEADVNAQRSEDLLKVFSSALKMVKKKLEISCINLFLCSKF